MIFSFEGRAFTSGGAEVTPAFAVAYLSDDGRSVTNWHGQVLGPARVTATWRLPHYCYVSSHMHQVEAVIDGITYTGRCAGEGMIWRGRPKRGRRR